MGVKRARKLLIQAGYVLVSPVAFVLLMLALAIRPFIKVQFFLIPFRFGTSLGYAVVDIKEIRTQVGERPIRRLYLAAPENKSANSEMLRWLAPQARWVLIPKALVVPVVALSSRIPILKGLIRDSPSADQIHAMHHDFSLNLPPDLARLSDELGVRTKIFGSKPRVALLVRDSLATREELGASHSRKNEFRNSTVDFYRQAIETTVRRGYSVVRVGHRATAMVNPPHQGFFDYSQSQLRSPEVDLALPMLFNALVTNSSGLDSLYHLLGVPLIGINIPWIDASYRHCRLILPKHLFLESSPDSEIPLIELVSPDCDWVGMPTVRSEKVQFREASPDEIDEALQIALDVIEDPASARSLHRVCEPLWREFWELRRRSGVNMHKFQYETEPTILIPPSVQRRFLSI